jgi:transcriptional regulator with XRE-family HTH domain
METPTIPKIAQLHRKMGEILIAKPTGLSGPEIRFLRKSAGFPAKEFSALLGVTASHLSRVENAKDGLEGLGVPADKLARLLSAEGESAREGLLKLAARALEAQKEGHTGEPTRRAFRLIRGGGWQEAA